MKTAILIPGVFNPVTNAHIKMGELAHALYPEADIWYIPASGDYVNRKMNGEPFLSDMERLAYLRASIWEDHTYVSAMELSGFSFTDENDIRILYPFSWKTYDTVNFFKTASFNGAPYEKVYLCLGVDKIQDLHKWYRAEELIAENKIIVFDRAGNTFSSNISPLIKAYKTHFIPLGVDGAISDISSTKVRKAFSEGDLSSVKNDIPVGVYYRLERKITDALS